MDGIADVLASEAYAQADITQLVTENADMLQGMGACGIDDTEAAAVAERSQQALLELAALCDDALVHVDAAKEHLHDVPTDRSITLPPERRVLAHPHILRGAL